MLSVATSHVCYGQKSEKYLNYILKYKDIAILHQQEYGIPASITLAQGLLESGAGEGRLAVEGNNHFGIKCHKDWTGKGIYHDDDELQECFRKYDEASESFEDHARFLKRKRYSSLFDLSADDYKGWAKGLKSCGYATDPRYSDKLVSLIEIYELYMYDSGQPVIASRKELLADETMEHSIDMAILDEIIMVHNIRKKWGLHYVVIHEKDSFDGIAREFGMKTKKLLSFNDIENKDFELKPGLMLYLQEKSESAVAGNDSYVVKDGDTLHSISQYYGIKLKSLYEINGFNKNTIPVPGDTIKLR